MGHLCVALHKTLPDVLAMSAAEFAFWKLYRDRNGFPADRLEAATAIGSAAIANTWGAKIEVKNLIPKFGPKKVNMKMLAAQLAALPGAKVRRIPRPDRAKKKQDAAEPERPDRPKVLNPNRR